jgi:polyribonucleotide 5'-hydroxyl-kinase
MPIPTSSPANPLGSTATSAPTALTSSALVPLVFWFGHSETRRNPKLMTALIQRLSDCIRLRLDDDHAGVSDLNLQNLLLNPGFQLACLVS